MNSGYVTFNESPLIQVFLKLKSEIIDSIIAIEMDDANGLTRKSITEVCNKLNTSLFEINLFGKETYLGKKKSDTYCYFFNP